MTVPALRFPEFEGKWEEARFDHWFKINAGGDVPADGTSKVKSGEFPFPVFANSAHKRGLYGYAKTFREKGGCITVSGRGELGIPNARHEPFVPIVRLLVLRPKFPSDVDFFENAILRTPIFVESTGVPQLTGPQLSSYKIAAPSFAEQKKIASFLGALDAKITALRKRQEGLERFKKGLMQALFSQRLRFTTTDGTAFPDWEEKQLGEIAKIYDGTHQTPSYVEEGVPFYSVEQVTANNFERTKFIAEDVFKNESRRVVLERNDILMTRIGDIGTCRLIDWDVRASFYVSLALIKCSKATDSSFLNQFIRSIFFQKELWKRTIHVAFPKKINLGEIGKCAVQIPHLDEQKKIADALSAMDAKITFLDTQVDKMEAFKKGLLQQMFV